MVEPISFISGPVGFMAFKYGTFFTHTHCLGNETYMWRPRVFLLCPILFASHEVGQGSVTCSTISSPQAPTVSKGEGLSDTTERRWRRKRGRLEEGWRSTGIKPCHSLLQQLLPLLFPQGLQVIRPLQSSLVLFPKITDGFFFLRDGRLHSLVHFSQLLLLLPGDSL